MLTVGALQGQEVIGTAVGRLWWRTKGVSERLEYYVANGDVIG